MSGVGHRAGYVRTFSLTIDGMPLIAPIRTSFLRLLSAPRVVFPTFESRPIAYTIIVALRVLFGRKTMINLLRAHLQSHRTGWRKLLHRFTLWFFDRSTKIQVLTIVEDHKLREKYPNIKFILDPEFWDLAHIPVEQIDSDIAVKVRQSKGNRKVLLLCGMITADKNVDVLVNLSACYPDFLNEVFIVVAGKIMSSALEDCKTLAIRGAFVEDRYLTDDEFISLFKVADFAWCCYAPSRDMSSGVFGRCLQLNVTPLVRKGSLLSRLQRDAMSPIEIDRQNLQATLTELLAFEKPTRKKVFVDNEASKFLRETACDFFKIN